MLTLFILVFAVFSHMVITIDFDEEGWPHFELLEALPPLKPGEQSVLIKEALVDYFLKQSLIQ